MPSIKLSAKAYPDFKSKVKVGEFHDYLFSKGNSQVLSRTIQTENMNSCTGLVLRGPIRHAVCHGAPELQALNGIEKAILKQVENIKASLDEVHAFVCGGWALNNNDKTTVESFYLANKTMDILDKLGIKFTAIWGKEKGTGLDHVLSGQNGIFMWGDNFKNIKPEEIGTKNKLLDFLEDKYQIVETNSDDSIEFITKFPQNIRQHL